jgi:hypothetical protein
MYLTLVTLVFRTICTREHNICTHTSHTHTPFIVLVYLLCMDVARATDPCFLVRPAPVCTTLASSHARIISSKTVLRRRNCLASIITHFTRVLNPMSPPSNWVMIFRVTVEVMQNAGPTISTTWRNFWWYGRQHHHHLDHVEQSSWPWDSVMPLSHSVPEVNEALDSSDKHHSFRQQAWPPTEQAPNNKQGS